VAETVRSTAHARYNARRLHETAAGTATEVPSRHSNRYASAHFKKTFQEKGTGNPVVAGGFLGSPVASPLSHYMAIAVKALHPPPAGLV
jgi:hypothetical protein